MQSERKYNSLKSVSQSIKQVKHREKIMTKLVSVSSLLKLKKKLIN
jgi:hypothetical protein